jgi:hypothetical protein
MKTVNKNTAYSRVWRLKNPQKALEIYRKQGICRKGITITEFNNLLKKQNKVCAICKKPETAFLKGRVKKLSIDHCHNTKKVRGLLCGRCNAAIGLVKEDIGILSAAITYLNEFNVKK